MEDLEFIGKCLLVCDRGNRILVVGDLHLGYEEALNQTGVFVSRVLFKEMMQEFDNIFAKIGDVDEIVLLGDVKHNFGSILRQEWNDALSLFDYLQKKCKKLVIIKGNHDVIIKPIAKKRDILVKEVYISGEYCFLHGNRDYEEIWEDSIKIWIVGHAHPAITLYEGAKVEKYKCFFVGTFKGKKVIVVPSFAEHSEGSDPRETQVGLAWDFDFDSFDVMVVGEGLEVLDFGKLKNIGR